LSGRGDKDMHTVASIAGLKIEGVSENESY